MHLEKEGKGRRSTDSIYNLYQIIELAKQEKRKVFLAFVDLRKAFDRVDRVDKKHIMGKTRTIRI